MTSPDCETLKQSSSISLSISCVKTMETLTFFDLRTNNTHCAIRTFGQYASFSQIRSYIATLLFPMAFSMLMYKYKYALHVCYLSVGNNKVLFPSHCLGGLLFPKFQSLVFVIFMSENVSTNLFHLQRGG